MRYSVTLSPIDSTRPLVYNEHMEKTTRTPKTNGHFAEIIATLPKSTASRFGYMVELAMFNAGHNRTADLSRDTPAEIKAYNVAFAATLAWMAE